MDKLRSWVGIIDWLLAGSKRDFRQTQRSLMNCSTKPSGWIQANAIPSSHSTVYGSVLNPTINKTISIATKKFRDSLAPRSLDFN